jgi:3-phytase
MRGRIGERALPAFRPAAMVFGALLAGCQVNEEQALAGPDAAGEAFPVLQAVAETAPVPSPNDAADDAVVLVSQRGDAAFIAATDKQFGLLVYDLEGRQLAALGSGRLNNVDAISVGEDEYLLAASNRTTTAIELFSALIRDGRITVRAEGAVGLAVLEPYGLCMANLDGDLSVFVGNRSGRIEEWRIDDEGFGTPGRVIVLPSQTEGCVVDAEGNRLFVGEEDVGIWSINLETLDPVLVDQVGEGRLIADVEGLDIYDNRYLVASSQGSNSFAVYRLPGVDPVGVFRIGPNDELGIDGVSETDGVAVSAASMPGYPQGILVVQDGYNVDPDENQNFKIVDWREVASALGL